MDGGYLFAQFRFDFEQVNFEALLYLACLLLGCCFLGTEIGDLSRTHKDEAALFSPETVGSEVGRFCGPPTYVPRALVRFLVGVTPLLPPERDTTLCFPSQRLAPSQTPASARVFGRQP